MQEKRITHRMTSSNIKTKQDVGQKLISHGHVTFHMQRQMIGSGEGSFTQSALERSVSGMFTVMTG